MKTMMQGILGQNLCQMSEIDIVLSVVSEKKTYNKIESATQTLELSMQKASNTEPHMIIQKTH